MPPIQRADLPAQSLLHGRLQAGDYADCFTADIARPVSHAQFVEAFYTTGVFKIERAILRFAVAKPSTDAQAKALAEGTTQAFAAWNVEGRAPDQLLMADFSGRTRSWLMVGPAEGGGTRLYFGSAVGARRSGSGERSMGTVFNALLGFHKLYSRVLLHAARARLGG